MRRLTCPTCCARRSASRVSRFSARSFASAARASSSTASIRPRDAAASGSSPSSSSSPSSASVLRCASAAASDRLRRSPSGGGRTAGFDADDGERCRAAASLVRGRSAASAETRSSGVDVDGRAGGDEGVDAGEGRRTGCSRVCSRSERLIASSEAGGGPAATEASVVDCRP